MDAMIENELDKMEKEGYTTDDKDLEELMLNPLYINHQPTNQEIDKSIGLQGIQALLYNGPLNEQQTTYRTQGNTCLQHALKAQDSKEKNELLNKAIQHYNTALSINLQPSDQLNQQEIDTKTAIILANRSEANRLLQNYKQAIQDAVKSIQLDRNYCKSYCRLGAIFQDLNELQQSLKWYLNGAQHAETVKQKQQLEKICKDLGKQIDEINSSYKATENKIKSFKQYKNIKFGKLLNFVQMDFEQIINSWKQDTVSIYLIEDKSREIMTINDCDLQLTIGQIKQIIQMPDTQFCYYTGWTYQFKDDKLIESDENKVERKVVPDYVSLNILINQKDYIVPSVITLFVEIK